jgi:hypothetical protein
MGRISAKGRCEPFRRSKEILGLTSSPRCAFGRSCVPSAPISREYPATSAASGLRIFRAEATDHIS